MDLYTVELECDTHEMLKKLSRALIQLGYARDGYETGLLTREREHPTGLVLEDNLNVAIPHADTSYALGQVLVIIRRKKGKFRFQRMEAPGQEIPVKVVFLFIITDKERYMQFLSNFVGLFRDAQSREVIKTSKPVAIAEHLQRKLSEYDLEYLGELQLAEANPSGSTVVKE